MTDKPKRFDQPLTNVSCNDCGHYYDGDCDGHNTTCNSFKVARVGKIDRVLDRICFIFAILSVLQVVGILVTLWSILSRL